MASTIKERPARRRKAVFLIGVPGSGKTTLAKLFMERLAATYRALPNSGKYGLIDYTQYHFGAAQREWNILGKFDDHPAAGYAQGTDRLSMGAQKDFVGFVEMSRASLLIEGDRFANLKSIEAVLENDYEVITIFLEADITVLNSRYVQRGSNQSESFLKGRHTKVANLSVMARRTKGLQVVAMRNEAVDDQDAILDLLYGLV